KGADPGVAVVRQECNVDEEDFVSPAGHVEPADGPTVQQNELEFRVGVVGVVVPVLCGELHREESVLLRLVPAQQSQLVRAGAGVDRVEEPFVLDMSGTKGYGTISSRRYRLSAPHCAGVRPSVASPA